MKRVKEIKIVCTETVENLHRRMDLELKSPYEKELTINILKKVLKTEEAKEIIKA